MRLLPGLASATLLAAAIAVPASASEILGGFVDMRLGLGTIGGDYEVTSDALFPPDEEGSWDMPLLVSLDWIGSLGLRPGGGWIWGVGGTYNYYEADGYFGSSGQGNTTYQGFTVRGSLGYALPLGENFQLEVLPFIGVGRAYLDLPTINERARDAADSQVEYGANVNAVFTTDGGFQFGASAGVLHYHSDITYETAVPSAQFEVESNTIDLLGGLDFSVGVFIGVRL